MAAFDLNSITSALNTSERSLGGVDFTGKSLKLDTAKDAQPIIEAINACPDLHHLTLVGNTLGVEAAKAIAKALELHPELKHARWSDMFTGRMKTEIPPALSALGDGMITAGTRLTVLDLSDNAFGPIGVEGLAKLLQSEVCLELKELRLNNNGLGVTGGRLLASALAAGGARLGTFIAGRNRLENEGAVALAAVFERMASLEVVWMPQNGIYHAGCAALSRGLSANRALRSLNLNDNTLGKRGAAAVAGALARLKSIKEINFGDCLLKSKGAMILAEAIRDNGIQLESLDFSNNEIGREACAGVAACVTSAAAGVRVVLAGNSLGGAEQRAALRRTLGAGGVLSDGEGSDEEFCTGSSEEESEDEGSGAEGAESGAEGAESGAEGAESGAESADERGVEGADTIFNVSDNIELDTSGCADAAAAAAERFLRQPSAQNFRALGGAPAALLHAHLSTKHPTPESLLPAYVDATLCVAGLGGAEPSGAERSGAEPSGAERAAAELCRGLATAARPGLQWTLADRMLAGLGLIKSERKAPPAWDVQRSRRTVRAAMADAAFPPALRHTLELFLRERPGGVK